MSIKIRAQASITKKPSRKLQQEAIDLIEKLTKISEEIQVDRPYASVFMGWKNPDFVWSSLPGAQEEWSKLTKQAEQELDQHMKGWTLSREETSGSINGPIEDFEFEFTRSYVK